MFKRRNFGEHHDGGHRNPLYAPHHMLARYLGPAAGADSDVQPYVPPGPPEPPTPTPAPDDKCININVHGPLLKVIAGPSCGDVDVASAQLGLDRMCMEKRLSCGCKGHGHSHGYGPEHGHGHGHGPEHGHAYLESMF